MPDTKLSWDTIGEFLQFWFDEDPLEEPERSEFHKYYSTYMNNFHDYVKYHFVQQTLEISAHIKRSDSISVLEIGTGCGTEALWFATLGANVTTIDINRDRIDVARRRKDWLEIKLGRTLNIEFVESSLLDFKTAQTFGLVWMEQTYHHIEPRHKVFPKIFSLLNDDGYCYISETNAWNPFVQLQLFVRRGFRTKIDFVDSEGVKHEYGNERITTPFALRKSLRSAGFQSTQCRNFRMLPNINFPSGWLPAEKQLAKVFPALTTHYNVIGAKNRAI